MKRCAVILFIFLCLIPWRVTAQDIDGAPAPTQTALPAEAGATGHGGSAAAAVGTSNSPTDTSASLADGPEKIGLIHLNKKIDEAKAFHEPLLKSFFQRLIAALVIVAVQALLIWLIWMLFKKLSKKITTVSHKKIKPFTIKKYKLLSSKQITGVILFFVRIFKYIVTIFLLYITLPIVFSLFPQTRDIASALFGYILTPLKNILIGFVKYLPNLFTIIIIIIIIRYALKGLKFFANRISRGSLTIPGFYAEWAYPTYKILQVLLIAFTVAMVFPYLPGSESQAFRGVSVFVGVIFSLGSTTAIGNLVAGLVITYMRPFKIGDRVQIKETIGFVVEKNLMVVRIKTHKNEYVTFPNLLILGSNIINYNTSSDDNEDGLILYTEVTFGYGTPWQTIHEILIKAALATEHVEKNPMPFVLQTNMDEFYAHYQINCYTKHVDIVPQIYTDLYENVQNGFKQAGIDMTNSHHIVVSDKSNRE
jgi:small-conductance mechanosensitive channel